MLSVPASRSNVWCCGVLSVPGSRSNVWCCGGRGLLSVLVESVVRCWPLSDIMSCLVSCVVCFLVFCVASIVRILLSGLSSELLTYSFDLHDQLSDVVLVSDSVSVSLRNPCYDHIPPTFFFVICFISC